MKTNKTNSVLKVQPGIIDLNAKDVEFLTKFPIKFIEGNFADNIWGGYHLYDMKGMSYNKDTRIAAESWEVSGHQRYPSRILMPDGRIFTLKDLLKNRQLATLILGESVVKNFGQDFPILVKFIDVHQHMSVHLHPSRETAKALGEKDPGKEEVFIVIDLHKGAESALYLGLKPGVTPQAFEKAISQEENILNLSHKVYIKPGEIYHIPSGVLHCWTGGSLTVEITESSDLTYRLYDFSRRRPMHIKKGLAAINYKCKQGAVLEKQCRGFWQATKTKGLDSVQTRNALSVERLTVQSGNHPVNIRNRDIFEILMVIKGSIELVSPKNNWSNRLSKGSSILIPAQAGDYLVRGLDERDNNYALRISMKVPKGKVR